MKNIDKEKLQEIIENAVEKVAKDNSGRFLDDVIENAKGKKYSEALCICIAELYKESYRAVYNVLFEVLEHLD